MTRPIALAGVCLLMLAGSSSPLVQAQQDPDAARVAVDADDIGGVVRSPGGPEAGVWVIAETTDLKTKFRKILNPRFARFSVQFDF